MVTDPRFTGVVTDRDVTSVDVKSSKWSRARAYADVVGISINKKNMTVVVGLNAKIGVYASLIKNKFVGAFRGVKVKITCPTVLYRRRRIRPAVTTDDTQAVVGVSSVAYKVYVRIRACIY